jgi:aminoglycoside phosphotransferase family enzyme
MAQNGILSPELITELARQVAKLHRSAAVSFTHGGSADIAAVLDINDRGLRDASLVSPVAAGDFADLFRQALSRHSDCLEQRRRAGKVRRCHGDLILRNICLIDGAPTLFDCLEFNEALATIDVLYDLAFLLMDLWHRDQRELANLVYNRYLDECDEIDGWRWFRSLWQSVPPSGRTLRRLRPTIHQPSHRGRFEPKPGPISISRLIS